MTDHDKHEALAYELFVAELGISSLKPLSGTPLVALAEARSYFTKET